MSVQAKFVVGNIVKLKSGGPDMTIQTTPDGRTEKEFYNCQWFAGKKLESGRFPADSVELVTPEK